MNKFAKRVSEMRPSAIRAAGKLIAEKEGCISFAAGYPSASLMPIDEMRAISDELISKHGRETLQYGLTKGYDKLMEQIVKLMEKKAIHCSKDNIQITTGSQQGIFLTGMLMLDRGDKVVVENPTYLGALSSFTPLGCDYVGVDADDEGMIMEELEAKLKSEENIKMIYVVPNFSNPTGKQWSLERRKALLELAKKYDLIIVEDDPYGDIIFDGEPIPSIKSMDEEGKVIYLGSFSKILYAGLRVGFTVSSKEIADTFEVFKQGIDLQSNQFAQNQIAEYLEQNDLNGQICKIIDNYKEKRDLMVRLIDEKFPKSIKRTNPKGGMFVWLEFPEHINTLELLPKVIEEAGVGYVPGGPFFANGGNNNTARLNYSTVEKEDIQRGIISLTEFFNKIVD